MAQVNFGNMINKAKVQSGKSFEADPNQFSYQLNSHGTFEAEFRLVAPPQEELDGEILNGVPWVEMRTHKIKDEAGRERAIQCRKMLPSEEGMSKKGLCPICDFVAPLWEEQRKDEYTAYKSKSLYATNILVVKNPANPETEGKVFVLLFGFQVMNAIQSVIAPDEGSVDQPINPYDYDSAPNFVLKIKKKGGYNNYESSTFRETAYALTEAQKAVCNTTALPITGYLTQKLELIKPKDAVAKLFFEATGEVCPGYEVNSFSEYPVPPVGNEQPANVPPANVPPAYVPSVPVQQPATVPPVHAEVPPVQQPATVPPVQAEVPPVQQPAQVPPATVPPVQQPAQVPPVQAEVPPVQQPASGVGDFWDDL